MTKKVVAYFSASGVTARLAQTMCEAMQADLFEIKPLVPYTSADLNWRDGNARSTLEMKNPASRPEISERSSKVEDADVLFVGFPIWWYVAPTIINTFLESYDCTGKTIVLFATSGGSGFGKTAENLSLSCPGANLIEGAVFKSALTAKECRKWLEQFDL